MPQSKFTTMTPLLLSPALILFLIYGVNCSVSAWGDYHDLRNILICENFGMLAYFIIFALPRIAASIVIFMAIGLFGAICPPFLAIVPVIMILFIFLRIITIMRTLVAIAVGILLLGAMIYLPSHVEHYFTRTTDSYNAHLEYSLLIGAVGTVGYFFVTYLLHASGLYGSGKGFYLCAMLFAPTAIAAMVLLTFILHLDHDDFSDGGIGDEHSKN